MDAWLKVRQKDAEGEFYRKVVYQGPRKGMATQALYTFSADGALLEFSNATSGKTVAIVRKQLATSLQKYKPAEVEPLQGSAVDTRRVHTPPEGGLVVRTVTKVLGGYAPTDDFMKKIAQEAKGTDHLWVRKDEHEALARGEFPESLKSRLARFHLIDDTRGEVLPWEPGQVRKLELTLKDGRVGGKVLLQSAGSEFGYEAALFGFVEAKQGKVTRFDLVAKGEYWGKRDDAHASGAPSGRFPLAVSFTLADPADDLDKVPPQGMREGGYLK